MAAGARPELRSAAPQDLPAAAARLPVGAWRVAAGRARAAPARVSAALRQARVQAAALAGKPARVSAARQQARVQVAARLAGKAAQGAPTVAPSDATPAPIVRLAWVPTAWCSPVYRKASCASARARRAGVASRAALSRPAPGSRRSVDPSGMACGTWRRVAAPSRRSMERIEHEIRALADRLSPPLRRSIHSGAAGGSAPSGCVRG